MARTLPVGWEALEAVGAAPYIVQMFVAWELRSLGGSTPILLCRKRHEEESFFVSLN